MELSFDGAHGVQTDEPADVHIKQQPAGGADMTVFRGNLRPGATFRCRSSGREEKCGWFLNFFFSMTYSFESRRSPQFPLGLSIFINGVLMARVSTCCEYKHAVGSYLGRRTCGLRLLGVAHGQPCLLCRLAASRASRADQTQALRNSMPSPGVMRGGPAEPSLAVNGNGYRVLGPDEEEALEPAEPAEPAEQHRESEEDSYEEDYHDDDEEEEDNSDEEQEQAEPAEEVDEERQQHAMVPFRDEEEVALHPAEPPHQQQQLEQQQQQQQQQQLEEDEDVVRELAQDHMIIHHKTEPDENGAMMPTASPPSRPRATSPVLLFVPSFLTR